MDFNRLYANNQDMRNPIAMPQTEHAKLTKQFALHSLIARITGAPWPVLALPFVAGSVIGGTAIYLKNSHPDLPIHIAASGIFGSIAAVAFCAAMHHVCKYSARKSTQAYIKLERDRARQSGWQWHRLAVNDAVSSNILESRNARTAAKHARMNTYVIPALRKTNEASAQTPAQQMLRHAFPVADKITTRATWKTAHRHIRLRDNLTYQAPQHHGHAYKLPPQLLQQILAKLDL